MARKLVIGLGISFVAWTAVANDLSSLAAAPAGWSRPKVITTHGLTVSYPGAWHARAEGNVLLVWSKSPPPVLSTERVHPVPDGATWIWLIDVGHPAQTSGFTARPERIELNDGARAFQSCGFGFEGWNMTFIEKGHALQAVVGLGHGASKADASHVLDRLGIAG
jgi:hypothetical protein